VCGAVDLFVIESDNVVISSKQRVDSAATPIYASSRVEICGR